jgi:phosphoglycerol transferase MdoB-like AlkP superfamily enzyme
MKTIFVILLFYYYIIFIFIYLLIIIFILININIFIGVFAEPVLELQPARVQTANPMGSGERS